MQFNSETFEDKYIGNIYSISGPPTSQSKGNKSKKIETEGGKTISCGPVHEQGGGQLIIRHQNRDFLKKREKGAECSETEKHVF